MSIKIEIFAESVADLHADIEALLKGKGPSINITTPSPKEPGGKLVSVEETPIEIQEKNVPEEKKAATKPRKTKAAAKAEETEAPEMHEEPEEVLNVAEKAPAKKVSLEDIRELVISKGSAAKPKIKQLLQAKYEADVLPKVDEARYAELFADIEKI